MNPARIIVDYTESNTVVDCQFGDQHHHMIKVPTVSFDVDVISKMVDRAIEQHAECA